MQNNIRTLGAALAVTLTACTQAFAWPPPPPLPGQGQPDSSSVVEVGTRAISGNDESSKYREYREYEPQLIFGNAIIHEESRDKTRFLDLVAVDPGEDDQRIVLTYGRYGEWEVQGMLDELPHVYSLTARTIYQQPVTGQLLLPDATQAAIQAGGSAALQRALGAVTVVPLEFQQTNTAFSGRYRASDKLELTGGYTKMHKDGTRPFGMGFGSPGNNFVNVAAPIDQNIHDVRSAARFTGDDWNVTVGYWGSFFRNDINTLLIDNPLRVADSLAAGSKQGQADLDPNNDAHTISLSGSRKLQLTFPARLSGTLSVGTRTQNDAFVGHTVNTLVRNAALNLPAASLNGRQETTLFNLNWSGRPTPDLNLTARFRHYDLESKTPQLVFPGHVVNDRTLTIENRTITITDYTRQNASFEAAWTLSRPLTWRAGFEHENWERPDFREVRTTREDIWRTGLDWRPDEEQRWQVRSDYTYASKVGSQYNPFARFNIEEEDDLTLLQQQSPGLRKLDVANRKQHKAQVVTTWAPRDDVQLTATGSYALADYDASPQGLQADERWLVGTDTSWQANNRTRYSSFFTHERIRARQLQRFRTRQVVAGNTIFFDDPLNDWNSTTKDQVNTMGVAVNHVLSPGKWDTSLTATRQHARGATLASETPGSLLPAGAADGGRAFDFPEITDQLDTLSAILRRHLKGNRSLQFEYRYEHYSQENFRVDGLDPFMGLSNVNANGLVTASTDVFLGDQIGNYNVHVFALSALQRF